MIEPQTGDKPSRKTAAAEAATWLTFGIGLLLMGTVTLTTIVTARDMSDALDEAGRTRQVVTTASRLLSNFRQSQSDRRAYLLTGDAFFHDLYQRSFASVRDDLAELEGLVRDDSALAERTRGVSHLIASADSLGNRTIGERRSRGVEAAAAIVRSRVGSDLVDSVQVSVSAIEGAAQRRVSGALTLAHVRARRARLVGVVASVLAVLLVAAAATIIRRDIRYRRERSRLLKVATAEARQATQAKSEFLASMSHEIRTPLNGVIGMTELALETDLNPRQREYLETARSSAESLLRIINDILDFSKIEAGRLDLESAPFNLRAILGDTLRSLHVRAAQKNLALSHELAPDVPERLIGDAGRLQQVIVNLVGNAIKFTERGRVTVSVDGQPIGVDGFELHAQVRDTGIGIPKERQAAVFELFTQADSSTTRKFGGTGLGLTISERLVTLMNGRIWVESQVGLGSTFHFTARLGVDRSAEPAAASATPLTDGAWRGVRVLVVEDNEVNQRVARGLLERRGIDVTIANNGREALETLSAPAAPFAMVFMDIEMPEIDGLTATRRFRAREMERPGSHLPIVGLTAHALASDHQRFFEAGMDMCLTKPLRGRDLDTALQRYLGAPRDATQPPATTTDGTRTVGEDGRLAAALEIVDGDRDLLAVIAAQYLKQTPTLLSALQAAIAQSDAPLVARLAHTIKGSSLQLGASDVARAAAALEDEARDGQLTRADAHFREIEPLARGFMAFAGTLTAEAQ